MKRLLSILSTLLLVAAVSCLREEKVRPVEPVSEPTVPIVLGFDEPLTLSARTRATFGSEMDINPSITSIHVAVFGSSGYLKDYVQATPCDIEYDEDDNETVIPKSEFGSSGWFLVRLPVNNDGKSRRVHIIANGPSSLPYDDEDKVMKELSVQDGNGAYWQRLYLPAGIQADESADGKFTATAATKEAFRHIKLVRNFASVKVELGEDVENFELLSYTLCNMPRSGRVAMFNKQAGGNEQEWIYSTNPTANQTVSYPGMLASDFTSADVSLSADGYIRYSGKEYLGFPLDPELNTYIPSTEQEFNAAGVSVPAGVPIYVYERAVTSENPPFVLLAGRWAKSGSPDPNAPPKYYRLDLSRDLQYFPLYRNYQYTIKIIGVDVDGYYTPGEASEHDSSENFSVSLETENLADVSNGLVHLYVQQSFIDWIYSDGEKDFWYKFVPENNPDNPINDQVVVTLRPGGNALKLVDGSYFTVDGEDSTTEDIGGKVRKVRYYLNEPTPDESKLTSTLRLEGTYTESEVTYKLVRNVTIRVMNADETELRVDPGVVASMAASAGADADARGEIVTLTVPLPLDLQPSMFPLSMYVRDSESALNPLPSESMPVQTENQAFRYLKTLNWSDYEALVRNAEAAGKQHADLNIRMRVVKDFDVTNIQVDCPYFKDENGVDLRMDPNTWISPSQQNVPGGVEEAIVKVNAAGAWSLSVTLPDGSASDATLSKSVGSDAVAEAVTVTMPKNRRSSPVEYKLTLVKMDGNLTCTARIFHNGTNISLALGDGFSLPFDAGIGSDVTVGPITVNAGLPYYVQVFNDSDCSTDPVSSSGALSGYPVDKTSLDLTFTTNNTLSERIFYVRAFDYPAAADPADAVKSNILEVRQAAGKAEVAAVTPRITLTQDRATVKVTTTFATVLKVFEVEGETETPLPVRVYNRGETTELTNNPLGSLSTGKDLDIVVGTSTAPRLLRVKLYSSDGEDPLPTGFADIYQMPRFELTADQTQLASWSTTSAPFTFNSEVSGSLAWSLESGYGLDPEYGYGSRAGESNPTTATNGPVTLSLPANNTNQPRVYRLTATNNEHPSFPGYPLTAYDEVTQPAGTAWLEVNDSKIMLMDDDARVTVYSGFTTWVQVFDGNDNPVGNPVKFDEPSLSGVTKNVEGLTATAGRTLTVKLFNDDGTGNAPGVELRPIEDATKPVTGTINQQPGLRLEAAHTIVRGNVKTVQLTVYSDVNWTLSSTHGGTFSDYTGLATGPSGEPVTLNMPINYSTANALFEVTASATESDLQATVNITHKARNARASATHIFYSTSYQASNSPQEVSFTAYSATNSVIYATISKVSSTTTLGTNRMDLDTGTELALRVTDDLQIYRVEFNYYTTTYSPDSVITSAPSWYTNYTSWRNSGSGDGVSDLEFTFYPKSSGVIAVQSFTVYYYRYTWNGNEYDN